MQEELTPMRTLLKGTYAPLMNNKPVEFLDAVSTSIRSVISEYSNEHLKSMAFKHFEQKGKMLRPSFIAELAKALLLNESQVIDWAVACEILHNATLIHDDLQDGDEVRRGAPTTWKLFGSEQAINLGDFLLVVAPSTLYKYTMRNVDLLPLFTQMSARIVCGQVSEFEFNKLQNLDRGYFEKYLYCISGKTSTLFSGLALGVGIIANSDDHVLDSLEEVFFKIGHLFQMQDDVLDLFGDKKRLEQSCDIKEGKFSFLVAMHLDLHPEDFEALRMILLKERYETTAEDVGFVRELFVQRGTLQSCMREIYRRIDEVLHHKYLQENYLFHQLVEKLITKIMKPIKHIEGP